LPRHVFYVKNSYMPITRKKIGILGGGQLSQMLALQAHRLGVEPHILCPSENDPGAQVTRYWHKGDPNNKEALERIAKHVDVITFESEFIDPELVRTATEGTNIQIHPNLDTIGKIRDRQSQKKILSKKSIPSSNYMKVSDSKTLQMASKELGLPLVLKARLFGYDGYGTHILQNEKDFKKFEKGPLKENKAGFIAETFIPFKRELAFSIARNVSGNAIAFPLVETHQENSRCLWVKGPVEHKSIISMIERSKNLLDSEEYVGIMAFELFETQGGSLLVNELAPRVHNSAHHSQDSMNVCQFETHLRCILDWPLISPKTLAPGFAMHNLLGQSPELQKPIVIDDVHLHWYNKMESRPGRKMGHINLLDQTSDKALEELKSIVKDQH